MNTDTLFHRFGSVVKGVIKGFDRIVFKGHIRPILYTAGIQAFLRSQGVLNKNYKEWVMKQSQGIIQAANEYSKIQKIHVGLKLNIFHHVTTEKNLLLMNRNRNWVSKMV